MPSFPPTPLFSPRTFGSLALGLCIPVFSGLNEAIGVHTFQAVDMGGEPCDLDPFAAQLPRIVVHTY